MPHCEDYEICIITQASKTTQIGHDSIVNLTQRIFIEFETTKNSIITLLSIQYFTTVLSLKIDKNIQYLKSFMDPNRTLKTLFLVKIVKLCDLNFFGLRKGIFLIVLIRILLIYYLHEYKILLNPVIFQGLIYFVYQTIKRVVNQINFIYIARGARKFIKLF